MNRLKLIWFILIGRIVYDNSSFAQNESESAECKQCKILRQQLEVSNSEKKQLLDFVLSSGRDEPVQPIQNIEPIKSKIIPWATRKKILEDQERVEKDLIKKNQDLEAELGIGLRGSDGRS